MTLACGIDFFPELVTLRRAEPGYMDRGVYCAGEVESTADLTMASHPAPGNEVERLDEGLRRREVRSFYAAIELFGVEAPDGRNPDQITRADGVTYEVQRADDWRDHGGFWHALSVRLEVQP